MCGVAGLYDPYTPLFAHWRGVVGVQGGVQNVVGGVYMCVMWLVYMRVSFMTLLMRRGGSFMREAYMTIFLTLLMIYIRKAYMTIFMTLLYEGHI